MESEKDKMHEFPTGAVRGTDKDVPRYELVPLVGIRRAAEACSYGVDVKGYPVGNWMKGIPSSNLLKHALAHTYRYIDGDRSEDHLGHAIWNLMACAHNEERRPDMHDLDSLRQMVPDLTIRDQLVAVPAGSVLLDSSAGWCSHCGFQMLLKVDNPNQTTEIVCSNSSCPGRPSCGPSQDGPGKEDGQNPSNSGTWVFRNRILLAIQKAGIVFRDLEVINEGQVIFRIGFLYYTAWATHVIGGHHRVALAIPNFPSTPYAQELEARLMAAGAWDIPEAVP